MTLHDFGLWFRTFTMPQEAGFYIYYDGMPLGRQWSDFELYCYSDQPLKIQLKKLFLRGGDGKLTFTR